MSQTEHRMWYPSMKDFWHANIDCTKSSLSAACYSQFYEERLHPTSAVVGEAPEKEDREHVAGNIATDSPDLNALVGLVHQGQLLLVMQLYLDLSSTEANL